MSNSSQWMQKHKVREKFSRWKKNNPCHLGHLPVEEIKAKRSPTKIDWVVTRPGFAPREYEVIASRRSHLLLSGGAITIDGVPIGETRGPVEVTMQTFPVNTEATFQITHQSQPQEQVTQVAERIMRQVRENEDAEVLW